MMMTCRLLCALLVLALCCCPSVCASEDEPEGFSKTTTKNTTQPPVTNDKANIQAVGKVAGQSSLQLEGVQGKGHSGPSAPPVTNPAAKLGEDDGAGQSATGTSQAAGNDGTTGSQGSSGQPADQANGNAEGGVDTTTTTTTTKAPTTTTTTAPEAPSTTTTEAPAVSTTRAPSGLREIDGSLSSSAWVCAPLVLAASALAYTTVG
ncbi:putative mucin TcMUCII [Trypanosoma cruzi]|nr:putative mucin TcMUCII [Trypanosoma cruzi]